MGEKLRLQAKELFEEFMNVLESRAMYHKKEDEFKTLVLTNEEVEAINDISIDVLLDWYGEDFLTKQGYAPNGISQYTFVDHFTGARVVLTLRKGKLILADTWQSKKVEKPKQVYKTPEEKAQQAVTNLTDFLNVSGYQEMNYFANYMMREHRELQNDTFKLFLKTIEQWSNLNDTQLYDERNKFAVHASKELNNTMEEYNTVK